MKKRTHLEKIRSNLSKGKYAIALKNIEIFFSEESIENPDYNLVTFFKGYTLYILKRYEEALQCYMEVNINELQQPEAFWVRKALVLQALKKYEEALECYNNIESKSNHQQVNNEVWFNKGYCLLQQERLEAAIECYDKILTQEDNLQQDIKDAYYCKSHSLIKLTKYSDAIQCLNHILALDVKNIKTWKLKISTLILQGNSKHAFECCEDAIKLLPKCIEIEDMKISILLGWEQYQEANRYCDELIELKGKWKEVWNRKGFIFYIFEMYQMAIEFSDKALALDENYIEALKIKADALFVMGDYKKATHCYDMYIKIDKTSKKVWINKAKLYIASNRYAQAIECINTAIDLDRDDVNTISYYGIAFFCQNHLIEASTIFDKILEQNADDIYALQGKALCFFRQNKNKANILLEHANRLTNNIKSNLTKAEIFCLRGDMFFCIQEYENAKECYEQARNILPQLHWSKAALKKLIRNSDDTNNRMEEDTDEEAMNHLCNVLKIGIENYSMLGDSNNNSTVVTNKINNPRKKQKTSFITLKGLPPPPDLNTQFPKFVVPEKHKLSEELCSKIGRLGEKEVWEERKRHYEIKYGVTAMVKGQTFLISKPGLEFSFTWHNKDLPDDQDSYSPHDYTIDSTKNGIKKHRVADAKSTHNDQSTILSISKKQIEESLSFGKNYWLFRVYNIDLKEEYNSVRSRRVEVYKNPEKKFFGEKILPFCVFNTNPEKDNAEKPLKIEIYKNPIKKFFGQEVLPYEIGSLNIAL